MHVLLLYSIARIQGRFVQKIELLVLPRFRKFESEAGQNIKDAEEQISRGGPREQLQANIEAAKTTIEACRLLIGHLADQRTAIIRENEHTKRILAAARNTYRTVRLSLNVAEMISDCRKAFQALRQLQVPRLRPFQSMKLKDEMQRLTQRMLEQ